MKPTVKRTCRNLSPDELIAKAFRVIQSFRRGYYPNDKNDWIAAVKTVYKKDGKVFAKYLQHNYPHLYNQGVWIFGDRDKALRAAGFDPERMRMRRFRDQETIIMKVRAMRDRNLPLYARYVMKNHVRLFSGAQSQFGSWSKALRAAGIATKLAPSPLGKLRALRDALERGSRDVIPQALRLQAAHYFGSLPNAFSALKKDQRVFGGWSKQKIITVLSRMHRSKGSLAHGKIRRELPALPSAAEAYFGSWGKALYAAGIDSNLYFVRRKWRKPRESDRR